MCCPNPGYLGLGFLVLKGKVKGPGQLSLPWSPSFCRTPSQAGCRYLNGSAAARRPSRELRGSLSKREPTWLGLAGFKRNNKCANAVWAICLSLAPCKSQRLVLCPGRLEDCRACPGAAVLVTSPGLLRFGHLLHSYVHICMNTDPTEIRGTKCVPCPLQGLSSQRQWGIACSAMEEATVCSLFLMGKLQEPNGRF